jgi:hypothetical protein
VRIEPIGEGSPQDAVAQCRGGAGGAPSSVAAISGEAAQRAPVGRWVSAVNHAGEWGRWAFVVCKETAKLPRVLAAHAAG